MVVRLEIAPACGFNKIQEMLLRVLGEMAEWLKAHDWKSCLRDERNRGSNPRLSARKPPKFRGFLIFMTSLVTSLDIFREEIGRFHTARFFLVWDVGRQTPFSIFMPAGPIISAIDRSAGCLVTRL